MGQKLVSPATYWRRRVVVLAAGVAVLGFPIWAVNEALGGSKAPRPDTSHVAGPSAGARAGHGHAREIADLGSKPRARPSAVSRDVRAAPSPGPGRQTCATRAVLLTLRSARH